MVPLAHQGGWDEILLVVAPLALVGGLLWLANRRVTARLEAETPADGAGDRNDVTKHGDRSNTARGDAAGAAGGSEGTVSGGDGHR